jgi:putative hemolysin
MMMIKKTATTKRRSYVARLVRNSDEVRYAQRLRFEVFNLELNEGLVESHFNGLDADPFDAVCDDLIVEQIETGEIRKQAAGELLDQIAGLRS